MNGNNSRFIQIVFEGGTHIVSAHLVKKHRKNEYVFELHGIPEEYPFKSITLFLNEVTWQIYHEDVELDLNRSVNNHVHSLHDQLMAWIEDLNL